MELGHQLASTMFTPLVPSTAVLAIESLRTQTTAWSHQLLTGSKAEPLIPNISISASGR